MTSTQNKERTGTDEEGHAIANQRKTKKEKSRRNQRNTERDLRKKKKKQGVP